MALRVGVDAICEKPLVLNPWNLDALQELEHETGRKVYTVLQLRVYPALVELKNKLDLESKSAKKHKVKLTYITSRGLWYHYSWKGVQEKSGGIATNIGIHFSDILIWLFGKVEGVELHYSDNYKVKGYLELENAEVEWFLSLDKNDLPIEAVTAGKPTYRSMMMDNGEIQFSEGFTDLHTKIYEETIKGNGFGLDDARAAIELAYTIRSQK